MPDSAPSVSSLDQALGLVKAVIKTAEGEPSIAVLYARLLPNKDIPSVLQEAAGRALHRLALLLPAEASEIFTLIDSRRDSEIDKLIILQASLLRIRSNTFWVHHYAVRLLDLIGLSTQQNVSVPALMHANAALMLPHNRWDGGILRLTVARQLLAVAPRDALANALEAVHQGHVEAMDIARAAALALGITEPGQVVPITVSALAELERSIDSSKACSFAVKLAPPGIQVVAETTTTIPPPRGDREHYAFRTAAQPVSLPGVHVHIFENAAISIDFSLLGRTKFYVFDGDGACIEDLSWGTEPFLEPEPVVVDDDLCVIGDRFMGLMNVCHFILDHLSRIALYDHATESAPKILLAEPYDVYRRILVQAGFGNRLLEATSKRFTIRARRLLVSSNLTKDFKHPAHGASSWALDFIARQLVPSRMPPQARRIFISREDATNRHIRNWAEVLAVLDRHGFEIFNISAHSLADQIAAFAGARIVVGVHGAGLTNIVFGQPGLRVLEILPALGAGHAYWYLCAGMGIDYTAMIADDPELPRPDYANWGHRSEFITRDLVVDPVQLDAHLTELAIDIPPPVRNLNPLIARPALAPPEDAPAMNSSPVDAPPPAPAAIAAARLAPRAITVIANCQSLPLADALALGAQGIGTEFIDVNFPHLPEMAAKIATLAPRGDELVFSVNLSAQFGVLATEALRPRLGDGLLTFTNIHFSGLHPDITYLGPMGRRVHGYFEDYHSKLALFAFVTGRSQADCLALFTGATYERIGYFAEFEASGAELKRRDEACNVRYAGMFLEQIKQVPGLFTINHPTAPIFMTLANLLACAAGVPFARFDALFLENPLARNVIWPVYNEIAEHHQLRYRMPQLFVAPMRRAARGAELAAFIAGSYAAYAAADAAEFSAMVRQLPFFAAFERAL